MGRAVAFRSEICGQSWNWEKENTYARNSWSEQRIAILL
jgi:hypothetical protein